MKEKRRIKVASLFLSMEIGKSGGAGKVHATLGKLLHSDDVEFFYIQMEDGTPRYDYSGNIITLHEKFYTGFGMKKIFSLGRVAYKVAKICKKENIDVIIGQGDFFFMVTGLLHIFGAHTKTIALIHTTLRIRPKSLQYILKQFLKLNNLVVCISEDEKEYLQRYLKIQPSKLQLIYNSIDIHYIEQLSGVDTPTAIYSNNLFTYIAVGRLTYQKNYSCLVEAFSKVYQKTSNIQLIIIGDGEDFEVIKQQKNGLIGGNNIHLVGKQDNPFVWMKYADCFVMTSRFEGFPMVLLEAAVCGLPIISLDCPTGPSEIIGKNEGGICVPFANNRQIDSTNIATAMLAIQQENLQLYKERNQDFVQQFDNSIIATIWKKLIISIVG